MNAIKTCTFFWDLFYSRGLAFFGKNKNSFDKIIQTMQQHDTCTIDLLFSYSILIIWCVCALHEIYFSCHVWVWFIVNSKVPKINAMYVRFRCAYKLIEDSTNINNKYEFLWKTLQQATTYAPPKLNANKRILFNGSRNSLEFHSKTWLL